MNKLQLQNFGCDQIFGHNFPLGKMIDLKGPIWEKDDYALLFSKQVKEVHKDLQVLNTAHLITLY